MRKLTALLLITVFMAVLGCTVKVEAPAMPNDSRSIQRSNEAHKELDSISK